MDYITELIRSHQQFWIGTRHDPLSDDDLKRTAQTRIEECGRALSILRANWTQPRGKTKQP